MKIIMDSDLNQALMMSEAIASIETTIRDRVSGNFVSPPRFHVSNEKGALVFTVGGHRTEGVIGYRVYDTFKDVDEEHDQLVVVHDAATGRPKGIVLGKELGAFRTGAIGGVAIKYLSRTDSRVLGLIGSGRQARTQLMAAAQVRTLSQIKVFSRTRENRENFAREMSLELGLDVIPAGLAKEAVQGSDIVICATNSPTPVFEANWLSPGAHVTTVGPKLNDRHEISVEVAQRSGWIATDSLEQMKNYPKRYFLDHESSNVEICDLGKWVTSSEQRIRPATMISLFCSVGLAGTEVVLADLALSKVPDSPMTSSDNRL